MARGTRAQAQITSAMRLFGQHGDPHHALHNQDAWHPQVMQISALTGDGVDRFWREVTHFRRLQTANGALPSRRRGQSLAWMWERIDAGLRQEFRADPAVKTLLGELMRQVDAGTLPASTAARRLLLAHRGMDCGSRQG